MNSVQRSVIDFLKRDLRLIGRIGTDAQKAEARKLERVIDDLTQSVGLLRKQAEACATTFRTVEHLDRTLKMCTAIASPGEEADACEFWRQWLEEGRAEYLRRLNAGPQAVGFAQAKAEEAKS